MGKLILLTLILSLSTLLSIANTNPLPLSLFIQPCNTSPNPNTCLSILSTHLTQTTPTAADLLRSIIHKSILRASAASEAATDVSRRINEPRQQAALADCSFLMDLSLDRLAAASSAVETSVTDARTWLSAVLANHVTCMDGLDGPARAAMEAHLESLMALASTSLALLNAVSPSDVLNDDVSKPVLRLPSWVTSADRKLLEAKAAVNAANANVVVAKDGSGKYTTVQQAVDAAPNNINYRYVIYVKKGVYKETVRLGKTKKNIMITGDGMDATIITGSLNFIDGTTTFESATLAAAGDGFIAQDIQIQNTAGPQKHQAVALRLSADLSVINRCKLDAFQDTLYAHTLRQFYRDSYVTGTVDFIFGDAAVVFQNCKLVARKPMSNQQNLVTAQGRTDPNSNTGTSIQKCQVIASADLAPVKGSIPSYLGRPWKEYSRTMVMQSYIGDHVSAAGWAPWDGTFALNTLDYEEYANNGPGAGTAGRVKWKGYKVVTSAGDAQKFTVAQLIQGGSWLKSTGVTYTEGL
ncbi:Pectinesterase 2.2 [Acorus calamus]|uniref:Pectinesterase n=1 Tax=Acorus calamus TaxID=4465 RepID=A0AAV9DRD6_ACOCL|nr:Pectinesterase 2.2 [Acorus calamus]